VPMQIAIRHNRPRIAMNIAKLPELLKRPQY
jgi:hypothetical protein